jgi:hypothetical protein
MVLLIISGALCLGIVIGWLVRYFLNRLREYTVQSLASIVAILVGGTITKFLDSDPFSLGTRVYPVGLLIGILVYPLIASSDREKNVQAAAPPADDKDLQPPATES